MFFDSLLQFNEKSFPFFLFVNVADASEMFFIHRFSSFEVKTSHFPMVTYLQKTVLLISLSN